MTGTTSNPGNENLNPPTLGFCRLVAVDFATHDGDVFSQGFGALFWHRLGNWRMGVHPRLLRLPLTLVYRVMYKGIQWFCGIDLPYTVIVGRRVRLEHFGGMILIADRIGDDVRIRQNVTLGITGPEDPYNRPVIENGVGIGANAVVTRNVAPGTKVVGVPAWPINRPSPEVVEQ